MAEKILNTRIINKHDTEEKWLLAKNFIPKAGELIIYDSDSEHTIPRIKVGDNSAASPDLPFFYEGFTETELITLLTNRVPFSINADGSIYNDGKGYKDGYRVRSGGAEAEQSNAACTGFIKVSAGDIVRFSGMPWFENRDTSAADALNVADAAFTNLGQFTMGQGARYGIFQSAAYKDYAAASVIEETPGVWKWVVPEGAGIAYIRITAWDNTTKKTGKDMVVTIN
jgi:hypothetical protein